MEILVGLAVFAGFGLFAVASLLWGAESRAGFDGAFDDGRGNLPPFRKLET